MSANAAEVTPSAGSAPAVPKRITNAQTVCNQKNEKGKLCNGHLKQLDTAGELSEVHLRGDDVLSKCHLCGTLYMGPPLGHLRDPEKQSRFVEAELSALLQVAGGTLPVIKKNEKGVYVLVAPDASHGHAPAAAKAAAPPAVVAAPSPEAATAKALGSSAQAAPPPAAPVTKASAQPNRQLNHRSTYAGVVDTGPVPGETREQKIERLTKVVAGAKQVSEAGGGAEHQAAPAAVTVADSSPQADLHRPAAEAQAATGAASAAPLGAADASPVAGAETPADLATDEVPRETSPTPTTSHASSGEPDRTLMKRSTYAGVTDTGPLPGETFAQKVERLTKLAAAAKQHSEEGGSG